MKDLDVVLGREGQVLILDDTEGVWPRHRDNLITIERYIYFPADAARFGFRWAVGGGWWRGIGAWYNAGSTAGEGGNRAQHTTAPSHL